MKEEYNEGQYEHIIVTDSEEDTEDSQNDFNKEPIRLSGSAKERQSEYLKDWKKRMYDSLISVGTIDIEAEMSYDIGYE